MIEWTEEQKEAIKLLRDFLDNKSDDAYDYPFVINGSAGTGKSFLLSEYLKKTNLKYLVLCFTGKASNVLSTQPWKDSLVGLIIEGLIMYSEGTLETILSKLGVYTVAANRTFIF